MEPSCPGYTPGVDYTRVEKRAWSYTGDYKDPHGFKFMRGGTLASLPSGTPLLAPLCISPPQTLFTYMRVQTHALLNTELLIESRLGGTGGLGEP
jgi:hypothetical protein